MHRMDLDQSPVRGQGHHAADSSQYYYVELSAAVLDDQGKLLDSLIGYTFDTLHVQHLDLRIIAEAPLVVSYQY